MRDRVNRSLTRKRSKRGETSFACASGFNEVRLQSDRCEDHYLRVTARFQGTAMRIETGYSGVPLPNRKQGRPASGASSVARGSSGKSSESIERAESDPYLAALHDIPEVRADVIEEVRQRLNRGDFLSREAAEQTAEAILSDLASFIGQ